MSSSVVSFNSVVFYIPNIFFALYQVLVSGICEQTNISVIKNVKLSNTSGNFFYQLWLPLATDIRITQQHDHRRTKKSAQDTRNSHNWGKLSLFHLR